MNDFRKCSPLTVQWRLYTVMQSQDCAGHGMTFSPLPPFTRHKKTHTVEKPHKHNVALRPLKVLFVLTKIPVQSGNSLNVMIVETLLIRASKFIQYQKKETGPNYTNVNAYNKVLIIFPPYWTSESSRWRKTPSVWWILSQQVTLKWQERIHTPGQLFECNGYGGNFDRVSKLTEHWTTPTEPTIYKCDKCEKCFKFYSQSDLRELILERNPSCIIYVERFLVKEPWNVIKKKKITLERNFFYCPSVDMLLALTMILPSIKELILEKSHVAGASVITFRIASNLSCHKRTHSEGKPFICIQCWKAFKRRPYVVQHQKSHGKPFLKATSLLNTVQFIQRCPIYSSIAFCSEYSTLVHQNSHFLEKFWNIKLMYET